jgi:hypothetical protein
MNVKLLTSALALAALLPASGCETQDVRPDVLVSIPLGSDIPAPGLGTWLQIYVAMDECVERADCPAFHLYIDGRIAVWPGGYDYVLAGPFNLTALIIPPGTHVIELVEPLTGASLLETSPLAMQADMLHNLAVFGPAGGRVQRWFVNDPALVPEGLTHARMLNALIGGDPIQPVQCTDSTLVSCTALGAPIEHCALFEAQLSGAELETLGWKWAAPGITDAVVNAFPLRGSGFAGDDGYITRIPVRVQARAGGGDCPSCVDMFF